jgi:hypothetical protein
VIQQTHGSLPLERPQGIVCDYRSSRTRAQAPRGYAARCTPRAPMLHDQARARGRQQERTREPREFQPSRRGAARTRSSCGSATLTVEDVALLQLELATGNAATGVPGPCRGPGSASPATGAEVRVDRLAGALFRVTPDGDILTTGGDPAWWRLVPDWRVSGGRESRGGGRMPVTTPWTL